MSAKKSTDNGPKKPSAPRATDGEAPLIELPTAGPTVSITVRLPETVKDDATLLAWVKRKSLNATITEAVNDFVQREMAKPENAERLRAALSRLPTETGQTRHPE